MSSKTYRRKTGEEISKWEREIDKRDKEYIKELNKPIDWEFQRRHNIVKVPKNK
jgi:hypothetical protein